jgi:hypothetical protein
MLTYYSLRRNARAFKDFTGITVAEYTELYARFEPAWIAAEQKRLRRAGRQRAIGGGRIYRLGVEDQLLMVLVWLRTYPTTATLGYLFSVSQPTASRNSQRLLTVLYEISLGEFEWPDPPQKGEGRKLTELKETYPDVFAIIDATEQPVERPKDKIQENLYYSGKRRRPTCKTSIVVNEDGVIRAITDSAPGCTHDLTQIRESGLLDYIPRETVVVADAGYDGLYKDLLDHSVATAHKAQRNKPLMQAHKDANRELSYVRIIVENVFCHLKHFRILSDRFRHNVIDIHSAVFAVIAAIVNRRTKRRLELSNTC